MTSRRFSAPWLAALAVALVFPSPPPGLVAAEDENGIPPVIESKSGTYYSWVSADAAVDPNGGIRHEYFIGTTLFRDVSEQEMRRPELGVNHVKMLEESDCVDRYTLMSEPPTATSVKDFVSDANLILSGRAVAVDQGFASDGVSATMIKVQVDELLKASADFEVDTFAYVAYPYSRFSILGRAFCRGVLPEWYHIKVGDRVLVIAEGPPDDLYNRVIWSPGWGVVFEDSATGRTVGDRQLETVITGNLEGATCTDPLRLWGDDLAPVAQLVREVKIALESPSRRPVGSD